MLTPDQELRLSGEVIPFQPRKTTESSMVTTTIAALVAVTILHDSSHSPENLKHPVKLLKKRNNKILSPNSKTGKTYSSFRSFGDQNID